MRARPARAPARHWPDRPEVTGGLDVQAGGSWMAVNQAGLFATLLNGLQSLGPVAGKRSRGELPLNALNFTAAADAAQALERLDPRAYRAFNLIIADAGAVFLLQNDGQRPIQCQEVPPGLHLISHRDLNDPRDPRVRQFRHAFGQLPRPNQGDTLADWAPWAALMGTREGEDPENALTALTIRTDFGFETRCTAFVGLHADRPPVWWHREGQENPQSLSQFHKIPL